jgi:small subunit ribosomal protein S8e
MVITQTRSRRTTSGGLYKPYRKLKQYETGSMPTYTKVGKAKLRNDVMTGGNAKTRVLSADVANILDPKTRKYVRARIETVVENPANRNLVRRNVITKGTIIQTDKGKARVTSRPGQHGTVNAVLV